jgi:hypothetical protein
VPEDAALCSPKRGSDLRLRSYMMKTGMAKANQTQSETSHPAQVGWVPPQPVENGVLDAGQQVQHHQGVGVEKNVRIMHIERVLVVSTPGPVRTG